MSAAEAAAAWAAEEIYLRTIGNWTEPVNGWGDSIMNGSPAGAGSDLLTQLQPLSFAAGKPYRRTINSGISSETSTQIKTRMLAASGADTQKRIHLIEAGRNNFTSPTTVKADIAAMVAQANTWSGKYLVMSILPQDVAGEWTGGANRVTLNQLNADLSSLYGTKFIDMLSYRTLDGNGIPVSGLRVDGVHPNAAGYALDAAAVQATIVANGWS